ncbi:hypothetical protein A4A49_63821 [Nicotiana attenuata]|uniref:Uncharacterized protein n=1 Tax=Nicotiana attenuata TaxID=49451 RepID=A0A1J6JTM6_NICAT|nr:hypothetical protein A4A49_63821 [Nicotiana attenuata]
MFDKYESMETTGGETAPSTFKSRAEVLWEDMDDITNLIIFRFARVSPSHSSRHLCLLPNPFLSWTKFQLAFTMKSEWFHHFHQSLHSLSCIFNEKPKTLVSKLTKSLFL